MTVPFLTACGRWNPPPRCSRGAFGFDGLRAMRESARRAVELETRPGIAWYALARAALGFSLYLSGGPRAAEPLRKAAISEAPIPLARHLALSTAS